MVISSQPWPGVEEKEAAGNGKEVNPSSQHNSLGATKQVGITSSHSCGSGQQIGFCISLGRELLSKAKKFPLLSPGCVLGLLSAGRHTS